ncbi:hypothetical protein K438DRAFT_1969007 [Mycena galopus ATCC 62051]|nr:hypothetical protein K438DRAFT_1969007 [Mycena galopus ATCC 62051]
MEIFTVHGSICATVSETTTSHNPAPPTPTPIYRTRLTPPNDCGRFNTLLQEFQDFDNEQIEAVPVAWDKNLELARQELLRLRRTRSDSGSILRRGSSDTANGNAEPNADAIDNTSSPHGPLEQPPQLIATETSMVSGDAGPSWRPADPAPSLKAPLYVGELAELTFQRLQALELAQQLQYDTIQPQNEDPGSNFLQSIEDFNKSRYEIIIVEASVRERLVEDIIAALAVSVAGRPARVEFHEAAVWEPTGNKADPKKRLIAEAKRTTCLLLRRIRYLACPKGGKPRYLWNAKSGVAVGTLLSDFLAEAWVTVVVSATLVHIWVKSKYLFRQ